MCFGDVSWWFGGGSGVSAMAVVVYFRFCFVHHAHIFYVSNSIVDSSCAFFPVAPPIMSAMSQTAFEDETSQMLQPKSERDRKAERANVQKSLNKKFQC